QCRRPGIREADAPRGPVQQAGAEPVLDRREVAADHRDRHLQALGSLGEAAEIGHLDEHTHCGQTVHFIDPCNNDSTVASFIYCIDANRVRPVANSVSTLTEISMFQFSTFVRVFLPALALGVVAPTAAVAQSQPALSLKVYNADGNSFNVNAVVV